MRTSSKGTIVARRIWKRFRADRRSNRLQDNLKELSKRLRKGRAKHRWALRDVDFRIGPGEAVGVVGANGAGKSTLLKILTRVMYPTAGDLQIFGRVGALIELRGGMHPDLTGRENTFIYGSLLGLPRKTIAKRFDDIVEFADLSQAIDRQLKFYSSGMQMRLGFAVAAFLNPDVLLVDEVLAVGDAWFQQRCLDRMRAVVNEGTTLVLVSHDLAAIEAMCGRGLWIRDGLLCADGPIREVVGDYRRSVERYSSVHIEHGGAVRLLSVELARLDGGLPVSHEPLEVRLRLATDELQRGRLHLGISEGAATPTLLVSTGLILEPGQTELRCTISDLPLPRGSYSLWTYMESHDDLDLLPWHPAASFDVAGTDLDPAPRGVVRLSPVHVRSDWSHSEVTAGLPVVEAQRW